MFMYTIPFAEKQGLLFLNTPRDTRYKKDALRKTQRAGMFPEVESNPALYTEENAFPSALDNIYLISARLNTVSV